MILRKETETIKWMYTIHISDSYIRMNDTPQGDGNSFKLFSSVFNSFTYKNE